MLEQTKELCRLYNIKPARSRGQNFLIEEEIYDQIVTQADLRANDIVLEVGPGLGFLTAKLAKRAGRVIAVELDDKLAEVLRIGLAEKKAENVRVVNGDIMKLAIGNWQLGKTNTNFKIVANLPYNITSIFLRKFLEAEIRPELMALMLQKEVAERICARAGEMSLLAVSVQFYARPEILKIVAKENFWPKPEVDSAIIKLEVRTKPARPERSGGKLEANEKEFFRLVKLGFSAKRKMLKNNLAAGLMISQQEAENRIIKAGFHAKIRAQELSVDDWLKLFSVFNKTVV